jgi:hypothetical protein
MAEQAIRARWWAVLLFATALPGAQAQLIPADAGTQGTASPSANGTIWTRTLCFESGLIGVAKDGAVLVSDRRLNSDARSILGLLRPRRIERSVPADRCRSRNS